MQVPPVLPTVIPGAQPQDVMVRNLPQVQAQAAAPIVQRAVDPAPRSEGGNKTRSNADKRKSGDGGKDGRGSTVNIRV